MNEDKATRYNRLKRRTSVISVAWSVLLFTAMAASPASVALRRAAQSAAGSRPDSPLTLLIYVVALIIVNEIGSLPIGFYGGFLVERHYGLSNERLGAWALDELKGLAIGTLLASAAASLLYLFIRLSPGSWWLPAGVAFALVIVGMANLAPVVLLPLFYTVKPLDRESLRARLMALGERAGARVVGAYEWGLAEKTKKANAALTGLGGTRRILVSDTMLAEYSDDEIEVVLAHEMAHHVHGDIWKGIVFESALILAGFYAASLALSRAVVPMALSGPADAAGLPVLLLAAGAMSMVTLPAAHALSRAYERSADRFAIELTRNPAAFVSAMKRLAAQNLAEETPSKMTEWLFYSHPPIRERIQAAEKLKGRS
ncbi:MAG TPA: M48 family metallopeptidase [Vicinamibacterales bacterium]|jgi:STE24 endopeptidase|nr:M48 family metallopeptidase [Vicinamibacterales bacterium]